MMPFPHLNLRLTPATNISSLSTNTNTYRRTDTNDTSTGENEEDGEDKDDGGGSDKEGEAAKDFGHYVQDELMDFDRIEVEKKCFQREGY